MRISGVLIITGSVSTSSASVCVAARQQLEQARRRVDRVVEAEPAVREEHVAATSRPRACAPVSFIFALISEWPTFHMIAWPPRAGELVVHRLRALHLADELRARLLA